MYTLKNNLSIPGIGIHSGKSVDMTISPSKPSKGIRFFLHGDLVSVSIQNIGVNHFRSTTLTNGKTTIQTPEHFLSACFALSLTDIDVNLSSNECPILDGSAIEFVKKLKPNRRKINTLYNSLQITSPIEFKFQDSIYTARPSSNFLILATLSYPKHWLKQMKFEYEHSECHYIQQISKARTYGFTHEIEMLKANGLAKGGSLDNALVITDSGYLNEPRYKDELVRHKILDFIGDISIGYNRIQGEFNIYKPSHQANIAFLKYLEEIN
ncbi:MAG: UDP-3-O-acyl-N-acetylglucosamine deacetylase [Candidatus Margulisiibacteriota bacterium]